MVEELGLVFADFGQEEPLAVDYFLERSHPDFLTAPQGKARRRATKDERRRGLGIAQTWCFGFLCSQSPPIHDS